MERANLVWLTFEEAKPKENDVILVRGVCNDNGPDAESEFYVFLIENGEFTTDTGKPLKKYHLFEDYTFTHWAYIPDPKRKD